MRKIILIMFALIFFTGVAEAYVLNVGDIHTQDFFSLPYVEYTGNPDQGITSINFVNNLLDAGETMRLECFENNDDIIPFYTYDFYLPTEQFGVTYLGAWQDLNGLVKLTMLSGSVSLDRIDFQVFKDGNHYVQTFSYAPIPEPATLSLLGLGLLGLVFRKKKTV